MPHALQGPRKRSLPGAERGNGPRGTEKVTFDRWRAAKGGQGRGS